MKIAILADIHGNLPALQAVAQHIQNWQPDRVIVAGDTVNRGPRPLECLDWVQQQQRTAGWLVIRGNHEDYVLSHTRPDAPRSGLAFEVHLSSYWTYQQLNGRVADLSAMPDLQTLTAPDGSGITITHASMRGNRDGIYVDTPDDELRLKIEPTATLFGVGHTHRPVIRQIDGTLVVNAGAVGLPFDGDSRACYAQICWQRGHWSAQIIRLDYDYSQAERDFFESGFMDDSGDLAPLILDEWRSAQSRLFQWSELYQARVLAGQISMADSTREYMAQVLLSKDQIPQISSQVK